MFAYLRSKNTVLAKYQFLPKHIAGKMCENVRNNVPPLNGFDVSNAEVAGIMAEIYMREFACTLETLKQVNGIAARYHEHAFDNTDAYIESVQPPPAQPHEMTAQQRHASQLLHGVGNSYSEFNVALKTLGCGILMRDIVECDAAKMETVAQQFQSNPSAAEDAFDRVCHITKQVWSLVNMLAFSNLFRFADLAQPIRIPNQDDAIFIPYIPTKEPLPTKTITLANVANIVATDATDATHLPDDFIDFDFDSSQCECKECGKAFNSAKESHQLIITTATTPHHLCRSCGFNRSYQDEVRFNITE